MLWAYLATFQYFNVFDTMTRYLRSTYTNAGLISRQTKTVTNSHIDGLNSA